MMQKVIVLTVNKGVRYFFSPNIWLKETLSSKEPGQMTIVFIIFYIFMSRLLSHRLHSPWFFCFLTSLYLSRPIVSFVKLPYKRVALHGRSWTMNVSLFPCDGDHFFLGSGTKKNWSRVVHISLYLCCKLWHTYTHHDSIALIDSTNPKRMILDVTIYKKIVQSIHELLPSNSSYRTKSAETEFPQSLR